ncbi:MAG TPA: hypothetical protein VLJ84_12515 [Usitatibacter sp.]|nr:hypothetical protein [Usitatibacter sp.]
MSHERDHDHPPAPTPRHEAPAPSSLPKPDRTRAEHPTSVPREPVDPRSHPSRRLSAARPG